jgi:hypothetical protein
MSGTDIEAVNLTGSHALPAWDFGLVRLPKRARAPLAYAVIVFFTALPVASGATQALLSAVVATFASVTVSVTVSVPFSPSIQAVNLDGYEIFTSALGTLFNTCEWQSQLPPALVSASNGLEHTGGHLIGTCCGPCGPEFAAADTAWWSISRMPLYVAVVETLALMAGIFFLLTKFRHFLVMHNNELLLFALNYAGVAILLTLTHVVGTFVLNNFGGL